MANAENQNDPRQIGLFEDNIETQIQIVVWHLKASSDRGITSQEAFRLYGITRLAAVIHVMRIDQIQKGEYRIESVWQVGKNKFGKPVRYVRYVLFYY